MGPPVGGPLPRLHAGPVLILLPGGGLSGRGGPSKFKLAELERPRPPALAMRPALAAGIAPPQGQRADYAPKCRFRPLGPP